LAFYGCSGLTQIVLPASLASISNSAFLSCSNLTQVTVLATTPPVLGTGTVFPTQTTTIRVPADSVSAYQSEWSDYAGRIVAITP
jgi:hypothetical protein